MDIKECFTCITSQSLTDNSWNWTWYDRDMSNEGLSYLNLSMKASHVLKPHQHLGDNLWLDSDADKRTIMQTWNQFTSLENCQWRFVITSVQLVFSRSLTHLALASPSLCSSSQDCMELHGSSWAARWVYHQAPNSPSDSRPREHQRMVLSFSMFLCSLNCTLSLSYRLWSAVTAVLSSLNDLYNCHQCHIEI